MLDLLEVYQSQPERGLPFEMLWLQGFGSSQCHTAFAIIDCGREVRRSAEQNIILGKYYKY